MSRNKSIKEIGDERLLTVVERLQEKIAFENSLNQLAFEQSSDNLIANKILHAKYEFMYKEARLRNAKSIRVDSVITR